MFKKNKSSKKKNSSHHKKRYKKISQSINKATLLAAASTCQRNAETVLPAVFVPTSPIVARKINFRNNANRNSTMNKPRTNFKKFKDDLAKKPLKRLNETKKPLQSYSQKLANSIKRRAFNRNNLQTKPVRKLDFQVKSKEQHHRRFQLPKPKFYHKNKPTSSSRTFLNSTIEDGEIIEEIESSDDDDCIVVEPEVANICLDDDSRDVPPIKQTTDSDSEDDIPSCSHFEVDTKPEKKLFHVQSKATGRGLMYPVKAASLTSANDSCIIIDESYYKRYDSPVTITDDRLDPNMTTKKKTQQQSTKKPLDDSVIFVEENYIPLPHEDKPEERRSRKNNKKLEQVKGMQKVKPEKFQAVKMDVNMDKTPQKMCRNQMSSNLFTTTERKKLADYNTNTYNPGTDAGNAPKSNKRTIIIDGSNVAFGHGCSNKFSAEGIKYCIDYFEKMGHEVKAVIPLFRRNTAKSTNPGLLDQLFKEGKIVFTPCKNLPNQQSISYDDRFILQLAYQRNAAVVSNDNYRDLIHENPAFKKIIENLVIGYSWCDDIFILPKDPYGRFGPQLADILRC